MSVKSFFLLTASVVALSSGVMAADLPSKKKAAPFVALPMFTWAGAYVGVNAGYAYGNAKVTDVAAGYPGYLPPNPDKDGSFHPGGGLGGGQVGYNLQSGNIVYGLEADFDWSHITGSYNDLNNSALGGTLGWFGTVRARAGYAFDRTLIFVTGGLAYGKVKSFATNFAGSDYATVYQNKTETGWTLGAGAEYALTNNLTVKTEYLYVSLPKTNVTLADPLADYPGGALATSKVKVDFSVLRAGVNYKF